MPWRRKRGSQPESKNSEKMLTNRNIPQLKMEIKENSIHYDQNSLANLSRRSNSASKAELSERRRARVHSNPNLNDSKNRNGMKKRHSVQEAPSKNKKTKSIEDHKNSNESDSLLDMLAATPQWDSIDISSVEEESTYSKSEIRGKMFTSDHDKDEIIKTFDELQTNIEQAAEKDENTESMVDEHDCHNEKSEFDYLNRNFPEKVSETGSESAVPYHSKYSSDSNSKSGHKKRSVLGITSTQLATMARAMFDVPPDPDLTRKNEPMKLEKDLVKDMDENILDMLAAPPSLCSERK